MITSLKVRGCAVALLLSSLQACLAQVPSGEVDIPVTNSSSPQVYSFAQELTLSQAMQLPDGSALPLSFDVTLTQDARGRLRGSDITLFHIGTNNNQYFAGFYTASGTVGTVAGAPRVTLMVRGSGQDSIGGVLSSFSINLKYVLTLNVTTNSVALQGIATGKANFGSLGRGVINDPSFSIPLGASFNGNWTVQMNIVPVTKLKGSAVIAFANGTSIQTKLTGTYHADSGVSSVNLVGVNGGHGNTLHLDFSYGTNGVPVIEDLRGRLWGQTVQQ